MRVFHRGALCAGLAMAAFAQSPAFEVISIRPNPSPDFRGQKIQMLAGGRFRATNLPVRLLVSAAYNVPINPSERISGLPQWTLEERYDIEANAAGGAVPLGLPDREFEKRMQAMLRSLLSERFKMAVRHETKEMQVYALHVAKDGPKMKTAEIDCSAATSGSTPCHQFNGGMGRGLHAKAVDMADLAREIENWTDHPVIDETSLDGLYAFDTEGWSPMRLPPPPVGNVPNPAARPSGDGDMFDPARPTIFMVMQKLGLDLKQEKGPVDTYVVTHIERPVEN
jgi:uncharacterized protein (TIGR03435 family)